MVACHIFPAFLHPSTHSPAHLCNMCPILPLESLPISLLVCGLLTSHWPTIMHTDEGAAAFWTWMEKGLDKAKALLAKAKAEYALYYN